MLCQDFFRQENRLTGVVIFLAGFALVSSATMVAQRGGGGGGGGAGAGAGATNSERAPIICVSDCPALRGGLTEEDNLKNFRRALAMQASADQRAAFVKLAHLTQDADDRLQAFRTTLQPATLKQDLQKTSVAPSDLIASINHAVDEARAANQNFLASLTDPQKSGLKDLTKKLDKADSDLDRQSKSFALAAPAAKAPNDQISNSAANLAKALASFQDEQLALGKEMSILLPAPGDELAFTLPSATRSITVDGQTISIPVSGAISRNSSGATSTATPSAPPAAAAGTAVTTESRRNVFRLDLTADLSALQQNMTPLLRSQFSTAPRCGERIQIERAVLTPLLPASLVVADLHYERWICPLGPRGDLSRDNATEVASSDARVEIRLTPSVDPKTGLLFDSEIMSVSAEAFLRNLLRSGDLGVTVREQVAQSLTDALHNAADLQTALPPAAAQQSVSLQKAQFQDAGIDHLSLVLEGELQLSDEQLTQFAAQLNQRQSAQSAPAQ